MFQPRRHHALSEDSSWPQDEVRQSPNCLRVGNAPNVLFPDGLWPRSPADRRSPCDRQQPISEAVKTRSYTETPGWEEIRRRIRLPRTTNARFGTGKETAAGISRTSIFRFKPAISFPRDCERKARQAPTRQAAVPHRDQFPLRGSLLVRTPLRTFSRHPLARFPSGGFLRRATLSSALLNRACGQIGNY